MSIRHAQSNFRNLFVVAICFTCTAVVSIGLTIWWLRSDAIANASKDTANLAIVLAEQTTYSIRSIHLVLNEIKERLEPLSVRAPNDFDRVLSDEGTHQFLIERLSHLPQAEFIRLVDKNGRLVNTTDEWPWLAVDVSHTAHFQHFKNNNDQNIDINDLQVDPSGSRTVKNLTLLPPRRLRTAVFRLVRFPTVRSPPAVFAQIPAETAVTEF